MCSNANRIVCTVWWLFVTGTHYSLVFIYFSDISGRVLLGKEAGRWRNLKQQWKGTYLVHMARNIVLVLFPLLSERLWEEYSRRLLIWVSQGFKSLNSTEVKLKTGTQLLNIYYLKKSSVTLKHPGFLESLQNLGSPGLLDAWYNFAGLSNFWKLCEFGQISLHCVISSRLRTLKFLIIRSSSWESNTVFLKWVNFSNIFPSTLAIVAFVKLDSPCTHKYCRKAASQNSLPLGKQNFVCNILQQWLQFLGGEDSLRQAALADAQLELFIAGAICAWISGLHYSWMSVGSWWDFECWFQLPQNPNYRVTK